MAAFPGDFEEPADDRFEPPLPPDDRLWRHPSELGASGALGLDPVAVRRRWLSNPPSKASAWTAGVVGALLATGLVALGTHLASAFVTHPPATPASSPVATAAGATPRDGAVGPSLATSIHRAGRSVASVDVSRGGADAHFLGIVVRPDGTVLVPAAAVSSGGTVLVTFADAVPYVARVIAADPRSGLALLHVNGVHDLAVPQLGSATALSEQSFALAVTAPGGTRFSLGTLTSMDRRASVQGAVLTDVLGTDVPAAKAPPGSALIDTSGALVGMVAGNAGGRAVVVPSWVVAPVVDQLLHGGKVHHSWLGVTGRSLTRSGFRPSGVLLTRVVPGSAAGIAGLRAGDIITSVDFQPVASITGLLGHLYGLRAGDEILVGVDRGTTDLFYRVVLHGGAPAAGITG